MQLRRQHTIKRAREFARVRLRGRSCTGRYFVVGLSPLPPGKQKGHSRFGIITTKRLGHAVVRNRLRRQIRELLREQGDVLEEGQYVVVVVRQGATGAGYEELQQEMRRLIERHRKMIGETC